MMEFIAAAVASLFILLIMVFGAGALIINLYAIKKSPSPVDPEILQKEEHLESANPADLIAGSPRADELERQSDELANAVRQRIRDRTRQAVSGQSGAGTPGNS